MLTKGRRFKLTIDMWCRMGMIAPDYRFRGFEEFEEVLRFCSADIENYWPISFVLAQIFRRSSNTCYFVPASQELYTDVGAKTAR